MQSGLFAPFLYPDIPVFTPLPYSGSGGSYTGNVAPLNAAITAAINSGKNALKVQPGHFYCDIPVAPPLTPFALIGAGRTYTSSGGESYEGGVKFTGPYGASTSCLKVVGGSPVSPSGSLRLHLENMHFAGLAGNSDIFGKTSGPVALVHLQNMYKLKMIEISFVSDYQQHLRLINVWDSDEYNGTNYSGGTADPTVTADSSTVQGYTGRSFTGLETALGRSMGVPMIEYISPNTTGADVLNNYRVYGRHQESNGTNGVAIMASGGNGNNIWHNNDCKIETREGCMPLIALSDQSSFIYDGLLYAAGVGTAPGPVGSLPSGTAWKNYQQLGLIVAWGCNSFRFRGSIGYDSSGNTAPGATTAALHAFFRMINCENPLIDATIGSGIDSMTPFATDGSAYMIFDACKRVSTGRTRAFAGSYISGLPRANLQERNNINSTTTEA